LTDPFVDLRSRLDGALQVYVSTFCWDCRRLKAYLNEHNVPYTQVNISEDEDALHRLVSETGKRGVPYILVNNKQWVRGYHREARSKFDPGLLIQELALAF
jgi:glutaredoxin